jgi:molybdopterin molybdotransferase
LIEVREALRRLIDEARPLDVVDVDISAAHGRVLARPVFADRDFPPTDRSAMDGFAVRAQDLDKEGRVLMLVGEVPAGKSASTLRVDAGQAVRVMTGSEIPSGADAVVMVERTRTSADGRTVAFDDRVATGENVRRKGEDTKHGETAVEPGRALSAPEIAALSAVGCTRPMVHRAPVVAVLSTGDEVVEPHEVPLDHQLRNSNAFGLLAQLRELGIEGRYLGIARDERDALKRHLEDGLASDLLLITGGVSAGAYDLVAESLSAAGMELLFHKVAVKPGKPMLAGRRGACLVVGLPGNPISTFTGFAIFVAPALRRMMGYAEWRNLELPATLDRPLAAGPKRQTYHLVRLSASREGLTARPVRSTGSGDVLSLVRANGFVVTSVGCGDLEAGQTVPALLWRDFHLR